MDYFTYFCACICRIILVCVCLGLLSTVGGLPCRKNVSFLFLMAVLKNSVCHSVISNHQPGFSWNIIIFWIKHFGILIQHLRRKMIQLTKKFYWLKKIIGLFFFEQNTVGVNLVQPKRDFISRFSSEIISLMPLHYFEIKKKKIAICIIK